MGEEKKMTPLHLYCPRSHHPHGLSPPLWADKYVDDVTAGECLFIGSATSLISTRKEVKTLHASGCEDLFMNIRSGAEAIRMRVNNSKTNLLCISLNPFCEVKSQIDIDGNTVESGETLKMLGFTFGNNCSMSAHVNYLYKKICARTWAIRKLKKAEIDIDLILTYYKTVIQPVIEYAVQVYQHALTEEQSNKIESLHRLVLKIVYGFDVSYKRAVQRSGLKLLSERRDTICLKFARKSALNLRYAHWFPLKNESEYNLRKRLIYKEEYTATERGWKSPLFSMRRILNTDNANT